MACHCLLWCLLLTFSHVISGQCLQNQVKVQYEFAPLPQSDINQTGLQYLSKNSHTDR